MSVTAMVVLLLLPRVTTKMMKVITMTMTFRNLSNTNNFTTE